MTPDSPTRRVGGDALPSFPAVVHLAPMLSLESVTDVADVRRFDDRVRAVAGGRAVRYVLEPKFDGLSLEVVYRDGRLVRASTRGDGEHGEGVTENVKTIRSVPLRLRGPSVPRLLAVRGEAIMQRADFEALNERLAGEGEPPFANPRNAAAGSIRQLDARVTAARRLDVFFYDVLRMEGGPRLPEDDRLIDQLKAWGLHASPYVRTASSVDEVARYHRRMERRRETLTFEIDGIVLKVASLRLRAQLRTTSRHPRWALAFKFQARETVTMIDQIVVQVGRTGVLTPVALLRPVSIGGVTVARATLHNREEIARKDVRAGDVVRLIRAGDVIPEVVERVRRGRRTRPFAMPRRCPVCRTAVVREGPIDRCPNGLACPAQLKGAVQHFASRSALDIRGLGVETVDALVSKGMIHSVADVFALTARDLHRIEGFADVSVGNLLRAIERAKQPELWRFLHALGIPGVGAQTARDLAAHFGTLARVEHASEADLMEVHGVGEAVAADVAGFFRRRVNRRVIEACLRRGVRVAETTDGSRGPLSGRTVVFTGALTSMTRDEAEARARASGARTANSVSRETDLVVAGATPGSKYETARKLGVRIITERQFLETVGRRG